MPKNFKPIQVKLEDWDTLQGRALILAQERGQNDAPLRPYIMEASAFFEANRPKTAPAKETK